MEIDNDTVLVPERYFPECSQALYLLVIAGSKQPTGPVERLGSDHDVEVDVLPRGDRSVGDGAQHRALVRERRDRRVAELFVDRVQPVRQRELVGDALTPARAKLILQLVGDPFDRRQPLSEVVEDAVTVGEADESLPVDGLGPLDGFVLVGWRRQLTEQRPLTHAGPAHPVARTDRDRRRRPRRHDRRSRASCEP